MEVSQISNWLVYFMDNPVKMDHLGVRQFWETSIWPFNRIAWSSLNLGCRGSADKATVGTPLGYWSASLGVVDLSVSDVNQLTRREEVWEQDSQVSCSG